MAEIKKIYLDACCINRPFDDQTHDRVRIETEAIAILFKHASKGTIKLIGSDILKLEIGKTPLLIKKTQLQTLLRYIAKFIKTDYGVYMRAKELEKLGFQAFDSFHVACAEKGHVNILLTVDDRLLTLYTRNKQKIKVQLDNPISWVKENLL